MSKDDGGSRDEDGAINPGSNLFVTGIHPRLSEAEVTRMFEKYGEVEKCQIMKDPHTKESRGFGFVKMMTSDQADAAKEGLQGEQVEGRTFSIEKARRARPRTPTPGKYFGPPKRGTSRNPSFGYGSSSDFSAEPRGRFDRFDDRRRGGYSGGPGGYGREDPYRYRGYERRYDDRGGSGGSGGYDGERRYEDRSFREPRGYDRGYRGGEERGSYERRGGDRDEGYGGGRNERYGSTGGREERRGGGNGGGYDRDREYRNQDRDGARSRDAAPATGGYSEAAPRGESREAYGGGMTGVPSPAATD